jgi:glycerophosphoryl diester phosphodiesterase
MAASFTIWAHRGASARTPENTLAAFRRALAEGADGIELDVHLSSDGVPVVIHDQDLARTTNGRGPVRALTLRQLRQLDAGRWFAPEFSGEPLPTLEETLAWAGDALQVNIEIKAPAAGFAVLEMLSHFPRCRVLVSSFHQELLERLRQSAPQVLLGVVTDTRFWKRTVERARRIRAFSLHLREDRVSERLLAACRRQGLKVFAWTVDDPERVENLWRLGIDGVFTNDPREAVRVRRRLRYGTGF